MAWNEQLPEWNATGVEPPASKKNEGWKPDDRPPADWFNWLFNRAYKVMQEIRIMLGGHVDAAAPHSGHETPAGATAKASAAETNAKSYTDNHAESKATHGIGSGYYIAKTSRSDQLPAYADIQGKPSSFPPSTHTHKGGDITSKVSAASAADSVPWTGVTDKPDNFAPSAHKSAHASGGSDALSPADIGAATAAQGETADTAASDLTAHLADNAIDAHAIMPCCRAYHDANQSIAYNTQMALAFNGERFDTDAIHDTTTNNTRLTCKTAGKYLIIGQVGWGKNTTGVRSSRIRLNGSTWIAVSHDETVAIASYGNVQSISTIYQLNVNDYVELVVFQTSGGALDVVTGVNYSPEFSIVKVG